MSSNIRASTEERGGAAFSKSDSALGSHWLKFCYGTVELASRPQYGTGSYRTVAKYLIYLADTIR